jgi:uncharacterized membrane protein
MKVRLQNTWESLRSSYWFVPGLMGISAIVFSFITIALDMELESDVIRTLGIFWTGGSEGARGLLETIAGSMITVAGVTFSITMVALSQASAQFGPRLLRSFMRDTGNQIVLGTFIATFLYCIMILRTVRTDPEFVPYISVTTGIVSAIISLAVLIYFIHHLARSLQAPYIIAEVAQDLFHSIERLFPSEVGQKPPEKEGERIKEDFEKAFEQNGEKIVAPRSGYLQAIDDEGLMELAKSNDLVLRLLNRPGHFVVHDNLLVEVASTRQIDDNLKNQIQNAFFIGKERTPTQDVEFAISQLVEVAVRSLSTGMNDPITAITCIDWLSAALSHLVTKPFPSPIRYDDQGKLRLVFDKPLTFDGVTDTAFNQIRQYSEGRVDVSIRLLEGISFIIEQTENEEYKKMLLRHARLVERRSVKEATARDDRKDLEARFDQANNQPDRSG